MYVVLRRSDHTAIAYRLVRKLPRVAICVQVCAARQFHLIHPRGSDASVACAPGLHGDRAAAPCHASSSLDAASRARGHPLTRSMPKFKGHSEFVAPSLMMPRPSSSASLHRFPEHVRYAQVLA